MKPNKFTQDFKERLNASNAVYEKQKPGVFLFKDMINFSFEYLENIQYNTDEKRYLFLEFGTGSGSTTNYIYSKIEKISDSLPLNKISSLRLYTFDWFNGIPQDWRKGFPKGSFKFKKPEFENSNIILKEGLFSETIPVFLKNCKANKTKSNKDYVIKFIHIDCDTKESTTEILELTKPMWDSKVYLLFDEIYGYENWEELGEFAAFREFMESNPNLAYNVLGHNALHEQAFIEIYSLG